MHPRNKIRLQAGIPIDPLLEKAGSYSTDINGKKMGDYPGKVDGKNKCKKKHGYDARDAGTDTGVSESHVDTDKDKKVQDKSGKVWKIIGHGKGEGDDETYQLECPKTGKQTEKKASELVNEMDGMTPAPANTPSDDTAPKLSKHFGDGDIVLYDDGIYIVVIADPQADMVGIIPAGLADASADEKNRAVEMVKPDKVRKPTEEERKAMQKSDAELSTVDDDMDITLNMENMKGEYDPPTGREAEMEEERKYRDELNKPWPKKKKTKTKKEIKEGIGDALKRAMSAKKHPMKDVKGVKRTSNSLNKAIKNGRVKTSDEECELTAESTLNYKGNQVSHKDTTQDPINVVGQGDKNWANSLDSKVVKNEYTQQVDNRDDQSANEDEEKVKVPANIKKGLKDAIKAFKDDAARQGNTPTARENAQFYMDSAEAFQELLDRLDGTVAGMKKAQIFAQTLMGPMLHKLPDGVWDFISNGGQKRALKDYMIKVGEKQK